MAKPFRPPLFIRLGNLLTSTFLRLGVRIATNTLLTVPGRKSGLPRTTPVTIIEYEGGRYIQSPFGEVDWVRNLRAAGSGTLTRGRHVEKVTATELSPEEAAPILTQALAMAPSVIRAYYHVESDAPHHEMVREARRHPFFKLTGTTSGSLIGAASGTRPA